MSPTETISFGFETKLLLIFDICNSPSSCNPISTNAPNDATFLTVPFNSIPGFKSSIVSISLFNIGGSISLRGSNPGFNNSFIMSFIVYKSVFRTFTNSSVFVFFKVFLKLSSFIFFISSFKYSNNLFVIS